VKFAFPLADARLLDVQPSGPVACFASIETNIAGAGKPEEFNEQLHRFEGAYPP